MKVILYECDVCREKFYRERRWYFLPYGTRGNQPPWSTPRDLCASCSDYLSDILGLPRRT